MSGSLGKVHFVIILLNCRFFNLSIQFAALKSERNDGNGMKLGGATLRWAKVFRE